MAALSVVDNEEVVALMKHAKTRSSKIRSKEPSIADTSRSPNRTVDDSPGTEDLARRTDIRDPLRAPGQLPAYARRKNHLDSDEVYGNTEIPHRSRQQKPRAQPAVGKRGR